MTTFLSGLPRLRPGPWKMLAAVGAAPGVAIRMQPFFLWAVTWSFLVTLAGTVMFIAFSH